MVLFLIGQRLDHGFRRLLPLGTTLLFMLVGMIAWPIPRLGEVSPSLALMAIYYWSVHRPDLMQPLAIFLLGLLHDTPHLLPMGLSSFTFVAVYQLLITQRRLFVGQAFPMLWFGFAVIALLVMLGQWLILSIYYFQWVAFVPVLLQTVLTIVLFPLAAWILIRAQRLLSGSEHDA